MLLYVDSQYTSPYAMSVFVALKEKNIPFELRTIDLLNGANHSAEYAMQSLTARVPTLVDGEFSLSESSAVTEYLDEVYPGTALYPSDPKTKARMLVSRYVSEPANTALRGWHRRRRATPAHTIGPDAVRTKHEA